MEKGHIVGLFKKKFRIHGKLTSTFFFPFLALFLTFTLGHSTPRCSVDIIQVDPGIWFLLVNVASLFFLHFCKGGNTTLSSESFVLFCFNFKCPTIQWNVTEMKTITSFGG